MSQKSGELAFWALACGLIMAWVIFQFGPLIGCMGDCYADLENLHGHGVGIMELIDTRLNTWILAWTQHALTTSNTALFDANAFYPATGALAGSEHLLAQALIGLPLAAFTDNAVLVYGFVLIATYVLLGISSLLFARWLTGSKAIALAVAIATMAMPWRTAELSHLQLLSASGFPLIWLFALRLMLGQGSRRDSIGLTLTLTLQLLASYYLSYLITFSLGIFGLVVLAMRGIDWASIKKLAPPVLISYGILAAVSIPYLERAARGELAVTLDPENPIGGDHLANSLAMLMPRFDTLWARNPGFEPAFFIPFTLLGLAFIAFAWLWPMKRLAPGTITSSDQRSQVAVVALSACCVFAFAMTLGSHIEVGEASIRLPSYWASLYVPGFSNLRAPHRWAIVIGTAMPILAALGVAWLVRLFPQEKTFLSGRVSLRGFVMITVGILVAINLPWMRVPIRPALEGATRHERLYSALEQLPHGPVLEIPWHLEAILRDREDSTYMLATTRHWRPILNGFTAHLPPPYLLLNRIAQGLPEASAVRRLSLLTDLRWIVVHWDLLPPGKKNAWQKIGSSGLVRVYQDAEGAIFSIPPSRSSGKFMDSLTRSGPRADTLTGLPRMALPLEPNAGTIISLEADGDFRYLGLFPMKRPVHLQIENQTSVTWPGLDVQTNGLVQLRYSFSTLQGQVVAEGVAPLDADVPRGVHQVNPILAGPTSTGRYLLCADLVQVLQGTVQPLPVAPVEIEVDVSGVGAGPENELQRLAIAYNELHAKELDAALSRCARDRRRVAHPVPE